jgi:choline dehydrogenase
MGSTKFESDPEQDTHAVAFAERVRANQQKLAAELKPHYDFIVCGSGSSG